MASRCSWSIRAGRSGPRRTSAPGRSPKASSTKPKTASWLQKREFAEEVGQAVEGEFIALTPVKQRGGKIVHTWAVEGEVDEAAVRSNEFEMEWPPRSGRKARFPEVDRGQWFPVAEASRRIVPAQAPILEELVAMAAKGREQSS